MKKTKQSGFRYLLMLFLICSILIGCNQREDVGVESKTGNEESGTFGCYFLDSSGKIVKGLRNEENGNWYLFVPSAQPISELSLYYTGEIVGCSVGELNKKNLEIKDAFSRRGDQTELITENGDEITVVAMQSDLPSVQIYLNYETLEDIHQNKDHVVRENTVIITDPTGTYTMSAKNNVEMKGRGNSSWKIYDKKGYQIKFAEETSVLGMEKAQKWVLLANASDDSMLRNQLVYRMADGLDMAFVPSFEYVDLWVDGDYLGTYLLGEKVEIGHSRLDLKDYMGAIFEHDEVFYNEELYWFYNEPVMRHFTLKEIVAEEHVLIRAAMEDFDNAMDDFINYLFSTPSTEVTLEKLSTMIDVDSCVKYYLVNEYVQNREAYATSFFWYKDGPNDLLHFGPIWDFDTCMGNDGTAFTESYGEQHIMFRYLLAIPEFRNYTIAVYEQYKDIFGSMTEDVEVLKEEIAESADMNYLRWNVLNTGNPKPGGKTFYGTFDEAVQDVEMWLEGRQENFNIPVTHAEPRI